MEKKKFKMPSSYVIIMAIVILVAILSWVLPGGAYDYVDPEASTLEPIAGTVPSLNHLPEGCRFHPRCKYATEACKHTMPQLVEVGPGHYSRCLLAEKEG